MSNRNPLRDLSVDRRRFMKFGAVGAGFLLAGGALTACAPGSDAEAGTTTDRLVIGTTTAIHALDALDSTYQTFQYNAFDSLVLMLAGMEEPEPHLAVSWTAIDDLTTEFTLRENVKFHDGSTLTAEDVAFSFTEIMEKSLAPSSMLTNFAGVVATGPNTVVVTTKTPEPLVLSLVSQIFIVPKAAYLAAGGSSGFANDPIGSGPYRITEFDISTSVLFEAFPDYWGNQPATPTVELQYFSDSGSMAAAFEAGQLDVAHELPTSALRTLDGNSRFELSSGFSGNQSMMQFNTQKAPFDDIRVRQAANAAIDAQALIDSLTYGAGIPEDGQLPLESVFGYTNSITAPAFDQAKARALLAEAGAEGAEITIAGLSLYKPLYEAIGGQLAAVGFRPTIESQEGTIWVSQFRDGTDADLFYRGASYIGLFDADRPFSLVASGKRPMIVDSTWTELYQASRAEMDRDAREKKLVACSEYLEEQSYILFTYARPSVGAVKTGTEGVDFSTGIMLRFDQAATTT